MSESENHLFVEEGQEFAGGVLTQLGADAVNATRARVARGEKPPIARRLINALTISGPDLVDNERIKLIASDQKIYPGLKI